MTDQDRAKLRRETKEQLIDRLEHQKAEADAYRNASWKRDSYYQKQAEWWEEHYEILLKGISIIHPADIAWMDEHGPQDRAHMDIYNHLLYNAAHRDDVGTFMRRSSWMHIGTPQCDNCPLSKWYEESKE